MRHRDDGAGIIRRKRCSQDRFGVEMVGRRRARGGRGAATAAGMARGAARRPTGSQPMPRRRAARVHRDLDGSVELPGVGVVDLLLQLALLGVSALSGSRSSAKRALTASKR